MSAENLHLHEEGQTHNTPHVAENSPVKASPEHMAAQIRSLEEQNATLREEATKYGKVLKEDVQDTMKSGDSESYPTYIPRSFFTPKNSAGHVLTESINESLANGLGPIMGLPPHEHPKNRFQRILNLQNLGYFAPESAVRFLPMVTWGNAVRNTGALLGGSVVMAIPGALAAGGGRLIIDGVRWFAGDDVARTAAREFTFRRNNIDTKGTREWNTMFGKRGMGDIYYALDLHDVLERGGTVNNLSLPPKERNRILKNIAGMMRDASLFGSRLSPEARQLMSKTETAQINMVTDAYNASQVLYDNMNATEQLAYDRELKFYLDSRENWNHVKLMGKRAVSYAVGAELIGTAASAVKTMLQSTTAKEWGTKIKNTTVNVYNSVKTGLKNMGKSIMNSLDNIKWPWAVVGKSGAHFPDGPAYIPTPNTSQFDWVKLCKEFLKLRPSLPPIPVNL